MSLGDEQSTDRSTDDHLGFGASAKGSDEPAAQDVRPEDEEASYVDSWYQVLKAQAADEA
jgi:hypothetical protein